MLMPIIPTHCAVLVVGGGPGGSFTASALAREDIDTVLLEADIFPRYHVGESMLPSLRHFMRFIDLDDVFEGHGFYRKNGAAFRLNQNKREGYTNFISAEAPQNYTWNVIRSESDELIFRHAGRSGAKTFEGVRVISINFTPVQTSMNYDEMTCKRPVSATYEHKANGRLGQISFDYIVDASGRAGILHTKYLKNRNYNKSLRNIAFWGYWTDTGSYGVGTERAHSPFFEALNDESGWAWFIPLHNGTTSVGVVMNQDVATARRKTLGIGKESISLSDLYHWSLALSPHLLGLIGDGKLVNGVKSASDYSYSSSSYATPYTRTVGDAGCFIDPFFSSGVHLALTSGLSAAATICAAIRGDCTEDVAAKWHSYKITEAYSRFLVVVLSAYRQMRRQDQNILSQLREDNFDRAFAHLRPIIQGIADMGSSLSQDELAQTLNFCAAAFDQTQPEERESALQKLTSMGENITDGHLKSNVNTYKENFSHEELRVIGHIRARRVMDTKSTFNLDNFSTDVIDGMRVNLQRGKLGLVRVS